MIDVQEVFEKYEDSDEFLEFDRVLFKRSARPDLHAFLLLDELVPGDGDIVSGASHDEIYLETDIQALGKVAREENIVDLIRCGIMYNAEYDCLYSFV